MPSDTTSNLAPRTRSPAPPMADRLLPPGAGVALAVLGGTALWAGLIALFLG